MSSTIDSVIDKEVSSSCNTHDLPLRPVLTHSSTMNESHVASAASTSPKAKKEGLISFNVEHGEGGQHKLKVSLNLGKNKKDDLEDHENWKRIDQAFASHTNAMKAAEDAADVDDETAAANLAKRETPMQRLMRADPELKRLDISASTFSEIADFDEFLEALEKNRFIEVVHLSGLGTRDTVHEEDFRATVEAVGMIANLTELFVFRGTSKVLNEELLAKCLGSAKKLRVLMIWGYDDSLASSKNQVLAGAMRMHQNLERVTVTLPTEMPYASLDVYAMGFCGMPKLHCLNLRVNGRQTEAVMSPEATALLLSSPTIESLYLENLGLTDDHTDAIFAELRGNNKVLKSLDLKTNHLTDDAIYTLAQTLPHNDSLTSVDLSGVVITDGAGEALAKCMAQNTYIQHIELEGTEQRYRDEFDIPVGHEVKPWAKVLDYHLRLNRAGETGSRRKFVEALNSVSDHLQCLYTLVRKSPKYCDLRYGPGLPPAASA
uniref:Uncharacterized protein n=1 Tax=Amphora coffeiformis TaxID=265554 RepID=A0A7S3P6S5_9STRA|mmetsp:Transcript_5472/g.11194  ORF Transcript_5472/g.11194 Transcript_5472/m.11194 type:complete len:490 (-) Transcript_5472:180-1649(-)|eukprot:scaffold162_cov176-Amphora_coffeaeformis.AAC.16